MIDKVFKCDICGSEIFDNKSPDFYPNDIDDVNKISISYIINSYNRYKLKTPFEELCPICNNTVVNFMMALKKKTRSQLKMFDKII